ncbi:MAG TPA: DUF6249 domain-containing protein [Woeseiaceae bacterium]|nr:DUF6249 domain-containing protein [Woeseiaceae bacterium]
MEDILVPIVMFACFAIVLYAYFLFRYKGRQDTQQTIRLALDKGVELSPELVDRLGYPKAPKDKDLRVAIIWLALTVGLVLCGFAIPDDSGEALRGVLTGAAFPFALGVAYLIMWRFTSRD